MGLCCKGLIKQLLLILFLGYYVSVTFFPHTHVIDGVTIVHSHLYNPLSNQNSADQQHSENEIVLSYQLAHFLTIVSFVAFACIAVNEYSIIILSKNDKQVHIQPFLFSNGLRAPPVR